MDAKEKELQAKVKELEAKDHLLKALEAKMKKKNRCLDMFICLCVLLLIMLLAMVGNVKMAMW